MTNYRFSFLFIFILAMGNICFAQTQDSKENIPPFQKNKNLPAFSIRLLDSVTIFNTKSILQGKPSVFILFSPDCDHCAVLAKEIKEKLTHFDSVNLFMISPPMPLYDIKMFAQTNGLVGKKQIVVGQDIEFIFGSYFHASTVPFVVIYDKNRHLYSNLTRVKGADDILQSLPSSK